MFGKRLIAGNGKPVLNGFVSPKWSAFQDSLARLLKVTIAVLAPGGELLTLHNALPPYSEFAHNPALLARYSDFFRQIPQTCQEAGGERILQDPLGLPIAVMPLGDGSFLLLGGCLDSSSPERLSNLKAELEALGVADAETIWGRMPLYSRGELRDCLGYMETLYNHMSRTFSQTEELGQKMLVLSAVEEINKLMVASLDPERFDLNRILDLVASSLVILSDGEGAVVFTYREPALTASAGRGQCAALIKSLNEKWEELTRGAKGQMKDISRLSESMVSSSGKTMQIKEISREDCFVLLGVISPKDKALQATLSALINQVALALEVSSLYEVLQKRFGMLFNSIRQGIIITDNAAIVMLANKAAQSILTVQGGEAVPGKPLDTCNLSRQIEEAVSKVAETGCSFTQNRSVTGTAGKLTHLRWDAMPLLRDDGSTAGTVLVFDDITEPVNLFREIQDWERLVTAGEVAAGLAHEIRNPLATAKAAIQLFGLVDDVEKRRELMGKLENELDRMNQILTTFLSISKPMQQENTMQPVDLAQVIEELELLLRSEAHLNEIELVIERPGQDLPPVMCNTNSIKQVFLNIARNAIEAMSEGGRLEIYLAAREGRVRVSFRDNGPGISPENIEHITRPFFTTKLGGTGLGLSISSSIIKGMRGELVFKSSPGEGTTVVLSLPVAGKSESR